MEKEYRLGEHVFQTEEAYHLAMKDYDYIKKFMDELDLTKPEKAKELYDRLNQTDRLMNSEVGEAFKDRLVQIFVTNEVHQKTKQMEEKVNINIRTLVASVWNQWMVPNFLNLYYILFACCSVMVFLEVMGVYLNIAKYMVLFELVYSMILLVYYYILHLKKKQSDVKSMNRILITGIFLCSYLYVISISL